MARKLALAAAVVATVTLPIAAQANCENDIAPRIAAAGQRPIDAEAVLRGVRAMARVTGSAQPPPRAAQEPQHANRRQ